MTARSCSYYIVLGLAFAGAISINAQQPVDRAPVAAAASVQNGRGPVKSPEIGADGRVTFRLRAPNAKDVVVALPGNQQLAMQKDDQGVWSVTSQPFAPDIYTYSF